MKKTTLLFLCLCFTMMTQAALSIKINCTAGSLSDSISAIGTVNSDSITNLTITGTIDARDFKTMRDSMMKLAVIVMDSATIEAYTGTLGTAGTTSVTYAANTIPNHAFTDPISSAGKLSLKSIVMPDSITAIGFSAFSNCTGITSAEIPPLVMTIGFWTFSNCTGLHSLSLPSLVTSIAANAFSFCTGLTTISIPSSVTTIGDDAFSANSGTITVDLDNPDYSSNNGILFDKTQTTLIHCPISETGSYMIPSTVTSIGADAFQNCIGLNAVTILSTVSSIGNNAFKNLSHLKSINVYSSTPIDLSSSVTVFSNDTVTKIILYVPAGSLSAYQSADQWSSFTNIIEYTLTVSSDADSIAKDANSKDSVNVTSNTSWIANSDETWLIVKPDSATGNGTLIFTAEANTNITTRQATITVSAMGVSSKTITITQKAVPITLSVSASTASIASIANSKDSVNVTSNTSWKAKSDESWLTVSPDSAIGNGKLIFTAEANTAITTRQATVTISATGVTSKVINITQEAAAITLSVSAGTASMGKEANSKDSVDVTSNTSWNANSDETWLAVSPLSGTGDGTLTFTAEANPANTTRQAIVTVSATGATSKTVTITQDAGSINSVSTETVDDIKLYPNPARDAVYLSTVEGIKQVAICNIEGRVLVNLKNITKQNIDISNLEKGVYFFYITTERGTSLKKIVKE